jgi:hypothetical protein
MKPHVYERHCNRSYIHDVNLSCSMLMHTQAGSDEIVDVSRRRTRLVKAALKLQKVARAQPHRKMDVLNKMTRTGGLVSLVTGYRVDLELG